VPLVIIRASDAWSHLRSEPMIHGDQTAPSAALNAPPPGTGTVTELLDVRAADAPDRIAVSFPGDAHSYSALAESAMLSARRLRAAGVDRGDRVGILLREASEPYLSYALGAMRLGAICVPINARNKTHELAYVTKHAGLRLLLSSAEFDSLIHDAGLPEGCRYVQIGADAGFAADAEAVSAGEIAAMQRHVQPEDPALVLYTSGTTANPKGCLLSHAALVAAGRNGAERMQLTPDDRMWTPLAMFHIGGWQVLLTCMAGGGRLSHVGVFEAGAALDQLERERVTIAFPAFELIWMAVLEHPRFREADLSALRLVINVGVPERLIRMQEIVPHASQISVLGMTESCGSMCMGEADDPLESRTTTSGRPLPGMELRVVDPATGEDCPPGVSGELLFRGVAAFSGYFRDPETTARTIDEAGWARTGDLVRREPDGTVAFVSRLKDMLKVGGENVSSAEIEGYLITHPAVAVAAVVGAPDARYGEVAAAFVQIVPGARVTEQELIDYCIGAIATFKVPRYVRFVDEYPLTATQKIQKGPLRLRIEDELRELGITEAPKLVTR